MGELQHLDSVIHLPQTCNGFAVPNSLSPNNKKRTSSLGDLLDDSRPENTQSEEISHASSYNNLDIDNSIMRRTSQVC